ncbi:peptidoglycan-binding protein [Micropruina sp.]|uniref:peptidoglycan-binding protein n=1 Tax=Micropruina sp. TaxID=2737536 RepID=UPI0039E3ED57
MAEATEPKNLVSLPGGGKLRADAAASYLRMRAEGMPAGGVAVFYRSLAKQAMLYQLYKQGKGNLAAPPNPNAPHVRGVAMDLQTGGTGAYRPSDAHLWLTKGGKGGQKPQPGEKLRAHSFGWSRTVPSERWHFGYSPAADTRRAADLNARLTLLGFESVTNFQREQGLTVDGKDGPATWQALLALTGTGVVAAMQPTELKFRFGQAGFATTIGPPDDGTTAGALLATRFDCSVYTLTGASEPVRTAIREALGGQTRWLVYPIGDTAVLWHTADWLHTGRADVSFGETGPAGAVRAQLTSRTNGRTLDVIAVQVRDGFATLDEAVTAQRADLKLAIDTLRRTQQPTIVAGDLGSEQSALVLEDLGLTHVSGNAGAGQSTGQQAWASPGVVLRLAEQIDEPGPTQPGWRLKLTLTKGLSISPTSTG